MCDSTLRGLWQKLGCWWVTMATMCTNSCDVSVSIPAVCAGVSLPRPRRGWHVYYQFYSIFFYYVSAPLSFSLCFSKFREKLWWIKVPRWLTFKHFLYLKRQKDLFQLDVSIYSSVFFHVAVQLLLLSKAFVFLPTGLFLSATALLQNVVCFVCSCGYLKWL